MRQRRNLQSYVRNYKINNLARKGDIKMTLEVLQKEMIAAMKSGNKLRKEAISSLVGAIKKAAIDEK